MTSGRVALGDRAGDGLRAGLLTLEALVRPTLGPAPRGVLYETPEGRPGLATDAWTICQSLELADPLANAGVRLARDAAFRLADDVGDGVATMLVMFHAGVEVGAKMVAAGYPTNRVRAALSDLARRVEASWGPLTEPVSSASDLVSIATLASDGDEEIGRLVGESLFDLGTEGFLTVDESYADRCTIDVRRGLVLDARLASRHLLSEPGNSGFELEAPFVLLHDGPIDDFGSMVRILEGFADSKKSLIIIADSFGEEALATLIVNKRERGLEVAAMAAPGVGRERSRLLSDLSVSCGAVIIGPETGSSLQTLRPHHLGKAQQAFVELSSLRMVEGGGSPDAVESHCAALRREIKRERYLSYDRELLQKRLARFTSGIATLRVGARTQIDGSVRKERARRAVKSGRAALAEGTLPGGGAALSRGIQSLTPMTPAGRSAEGAAAHILRAMLSAPIAALAENSGVEPPSILGHLLASDQANAGFNARTLRVADMRADLVLDAFPVVREAFRTAVSSVSQVIGIGAAVYRSG